jgi:epoxyqueuosine reductase
VADDMESTPEERIKQKAVELGFVAAGIAAAEELDIEGRRLREWLDRGYHATMGWMASRFAERVDPGRVLPGAKSVVALAVNYYTPYSHSENPAAGKISRYAWGDDYHRIVLKQLDELAGWMEREFPGYDSRTYTDTGPIMEKAWTQRAGVGWIGKHANVITTGFGSWVFLGVVLTTMELRPDDVAVDRCGTCTLCLEACPTQAIVEPYVVDSHLCLSYLTIEHRGEITGDVTNRFDRWVFGCDVCQDVCPWNKKFARPTTEEGFAPREGHQAPPLAVWAEMSAGEFESRFRGSPIRRARVEGLRRNARLAGFAAEESGERPG